jgi:hypothetical protein
MNMRLNKRRDRQPAARSALHNFRVRLAHRGDIAKSPSQSLSATALRGLRNVLNNQSGAVSYLSPRKRS